MNVRFLGFEFVDHPYSLLRRMRTVCLEALLKGVQRAAFCALTCFLVVGGGIVGTIPGAIKAKTTETSFFHGAGIGIMVGAMTAQQLLESLSDGDSLSKAALVNNLMNGRVFMEWINAFQISYQEFVDVYDAYWEISDIYDNAGSKGLPTKVIQKLPKGPPKLEDECAICLQKMKVGECGRILPNCGHWYHMDCIDVWLTRSGSCPICRQRVC